MVNVNGTLYFAASGPVGGYQLWKSDGTDAGTVPVNTTVNGLFPQETTNVNGRLFFSGFDSAHGRELWTSDGTDAGTHLVRDIAPGAADSQPLYLVNAGGTLVFDAVDGVHGGEPWQSDGTFNGTVMLADIYPGGTGSFAERFVVVGSRVLFDAGDPTAGRELWGTGGVPTAVTVAGFHAITQHRGVLLTWRTAAPERVLGFNLYRLTPQRAKLNRALIQARGTGISGDAYRLLDRAGTRTSSYELVALAPHGMRTRYQTRSR
jgi:ELWxxDGT repeat protein